MHSDLEKENAQLKVRVNFLEDILNDVILRRRIELNELERKIKQRPKSFSTLKSNSNPFNKVNGNDAEEIKEEELVERENLFGECYTEKRNLRRLVSESRIRGVSFRDTNEVVRNKARRVSKLNPVLMQLDSNTHNCSKLPLDLSIESINKPEPEKSDSMYDRLIHLNKEEDKKDEVLIKNYSAANNTTKKELTDTEDDVATINNSKITNEDRGVIEERVSSLKKLLNKKYVESKLQAYTFITDNEIKSVAALSIMPSKSFNLSEPSLINDDKPNKKPSDTQCVLDKEDSVKQVEDVMNEVINKNEKNNSISIIKELKSIKIRNEVKSPYNFVKEKHTKAETLPYNIERNSNEFYNKIMEDTNHDFNRKDREGLKERIDEIRRELNAHSVDSNIK